MYDAELAHIGFGHVLPERLILVSLASFFEEKEEGGAEHKNTQIRIKIQLVTNSWRMICILSFTKELVVVHGADQEVFL